MARPDHHYHPLVRTVARALRQRCGVSAGSVIVVGTSGGADSVALLRVLAMLAPRRKWRLRLIVGHVQHHLRDAAEDDAGFVQRLAGELGLPYARRDVRPGELPGNVEANARRLRYRALAEIADEHNANFIATAHHADDQLETLLMRLLRGSSVAGLRGIAWHKTHQKGDSPLFIIRPMLALGQEDITALLDRLDQPYREDATNADTDRTRARLRHEVLPVLKQVQGDAAQKAGALTEHFGDLYALLQETAAQQKGSGVVLSNKEKRLPTPFPISREDARAMNRAVLAEVLRNALIDAGVQPGRLTRNALLPAVEAAHDTTGGTRTFTFSNSTQLRITRERLTLHCAARSC